MNETKKNNSIVIIAMIITFISAIVIFITCMVSSSNRRSEELAELLSHKGETYVSYNHNHDEVYLKEYGPDTFAFFQQKYEKETEEGKIRYYIIFKFLYNGSYLCWKNSVDSQFYSEATDQTIVWVPEKSLSERIERYPEEYYYEEYKDIDFYGLYYLKVYFQHNNVEYDERLY